ncbi:MAG: hypothetical protein U0939_01940 [Pirellulales bacterium]
MSEPFDPYRKWLGIPAEEQPPNHYRLLGIPLFESDLDVIENAAHRQMVYVRTFQHGKHAELSQRLLNELASAKVCLLTPDRKQAYDLQLHADIGAPRGGSPAVSRSTPIAPPIVGSSSASATTPTRSRPTSYGGASRRFLAPLLFGGLGVVGVIAVVAAAVVYEKTQRSPGDGVEQAGDDANGGESSLVVGRTSNSEKAAETPPDGAASSHDERESRVHKQLDRVREMFAKRELGQSQALLDGVRPLPREEALRSEKERLELVQRFLNDFWKAVERGPARVKQRLERFDDDAAQRTVTFEFRGDTLELTRDAQKGTEFQVMLNGQPWTGGRRELPARAAVPLALLGMDDDDGFGRFQIAAFLFVDGQGNREENRRLAIDFYHVAVKMVGQPNVFLAAEFAIPAAISEQDSSEISPESFKVRPRLSRKGDK